MRRISGRARVATDQPAKPSYDVFLALVSLCAHIHQPWVIVTQAKLCERVKGTTGRAMTRRTLNRHLLALERLGILNRTTRHQRDARTGKLRFRATLFTFGLKAHLWIKRLRDAGAIPFGRLRVPKMAPSRNPSLFQKCNACGQIIHTHNGKSRPPRGGGTYGPPRAGRRNHRGSIKQ